MKDKKKLSISDALELRNEYDTHLSVLRDILGKEEEHRSFLSRHSEVDKKEYDDAVDIKESIFLMNELKYRDRETSAILL